MIIGGAKKPLTEPVARRHVKPYWSRYAVESVLSSRVNVCRRLVTLRSQKAAPLKNCGGNLVHQPTNNGQNLAACSVRVLPCPNLAMNWTSSITVASEPPNFARLSQVG